MPDENTDPTKIIDPTTSREPITREPITREPITREARISAETARRLKLSPALGKDMAALAATAQIDNDDHNEAEKSKREEAELDRLTAPQKKGK